MKFTNWQLEDVNEGDRYRGPQILSATINNEGDAEFVYDDATSDFTYVLKKHKNDQGYVFLAPESGEGNKGIQLLPSTLELAMIGGIIERIG